MIGAALVLCLLVGGSLSDSSRDYEECKRTESAACDVPDYSTPYSKEHVDDRCSLKISELRCKVGVAERCNAEEWEQEWLRAFLGHLETELCNQTAPSYRIIIDNLRCLLRSRGYSSAMARMIDNRDCKTGGRRTRARNSTINTIRDSVLSEFDIEAGRLERCLDSLMAIACRHLAVEIPCGVELGEVLVNAAVLADPVFFNCPPEVKGQLPRAINAMRAAVDPRTRPYFE